jgi:hypothetical protein
LSDLDDCVDDNRRFTKSSNKTGEMTGSASNIYETNAEFTISVGGVVELVEECNTKNTQDFQTKGIASRFFRVVHAYPAWFRTPPNVPDLRSIPNDISCSDDSTNDWRTTSDFNKSTSIKSDLGSIEGSTDDDDRHSIV